MKPAISATALTIEDDEWDRLDAQDVYYPDSQPGESEIAFKIRIAFETQGYMIRHIEPAATHPVWIIRAFRPDATRIDPRLLFRHVRHLLRSAGFPLRRDELTVEPSGRRLLVAFLWRESPIDYAAALRRAEEEAAEMMEMVL